MEGISKGKATARSMLSVVLVLAMALLMLPLPHGVAFAEESGLESQTVGFSKVEVGDTVNAYQLVSYDSTGNNYVFDSGFEAFLKTKAVNSTALDYFKDLDSTAVGPLLDGYVAAVQAGTYSLPAASASAIAGNDKIASVAFTVPGYYLMLGATTVGNARNYTPTSVYIQSKSGAVTINAGANNADITESKTVEMKSVEAPSVQKQEVNTAHANEAWSAQTTAKVGDVLNYRVKVVLGAYGASNALSDLELVDTLTNLEYVNDSVKVFSDEACTKEISLAKGSSSTAVAMASAGAYANGTQSLSIALDYASVHPSSELGAIVYVAYQALVKSDAAANNTASNSATLNYKYLNGDSATAVEGATEASATSVNLFSIKVFSYDSDGETTLFGKTYTVKEKAEGTAAQAITDDVMKFSLDDNGFYVPDPNGDVTSLPVDSDGVLLIKGLDAATYVLTEDTTPDGYYKPSDSYTVALTADVTGKALGEASKMTTDENNSDTVVKAGEIDGTDKAQFDIYLKPVEIPALPVTGGAGIIAYVLFGLLIASAGVMMVVFARKGRGSASCAR